jgi:hypothetical protein
MLNQYKGGRMQDDDYQVQSYQDDLSDDNTPDPFMEEVGEDPTKILGVPPKELETELDKEPDDEDEDFDSDDVDIQDDQRGLIEDLDDDPDDRGY